MSKTFNVEEEVLEAVKEHATQCNSILLCIIAPFVPLRVGPKKFVGAQFAFPDEIVIEDFVEKISMIYPKKEERPPLHIRHISCSQVKCMISLIKLASRDSIQEMLSRIWYVIFLRYC